MTYKEISAYMLPVSIILEQGTGSLCIYLTHDPDLSQDSEFYAQFDDDKESFLSSLLVLDDEDNNDSTLSAEQIREELSSVHPLYGYLPDDYRLVLPEEHPLKLY